MVDRSGTGGGSGRGWGGERPSSGSDLCFPVCGICFLKSPQPLIKFGSRRDECGRRQRCAIWRLTRRHGIQIIMMHINLLPIRATNRPTNGFRRCRRDELP